MIEWKQVDSLPFCIPCDWQPRLKLEKAVGCRLFRLRLAAREPGEDLIVRVKKGNFKAIRRDDVNYQALVAIVDDLKAIASTLRMTPISEQRKIKVPTTDSGTWIEASAPIGSYEFYGQPLSMDQIRAYWNAAYVVPPQWTVAGSSWVTVTGDEIANNTITLNIEPVTTPPQNDQEQTP